MASIAAKMRDLDAQYSINPSPTLYTTRVQLKSEYDLLLTSVVERQLLQTRQRYFEHGDRAGKLLAYQVRAAAASRLVPRIKLSSEEIVTDPTNISNVFSDFYSGLYASESNALDREGPNPLDSLTYPQVGEDAATSLGAPLTVLEITEELEPYKVANHLGLMATPQISTKHLVTY